MGASSRVDWIGRTETLADIVTATPRAALTLNGHRIHYDRGYATQTEGYPGLVVHGPLIATLLLDLLREHRPEADLASFEFRAMRPAFDGRPLQMAGKEEGGQIHLWAADHEGWLAMDAKAVLREGS
jgi:3-methylfumaryl-CoA hydratase